VIVMREVTVAEDVARMALSLAYSRMGQGDGQGEQARTVAAALYTALGGLDDDGEESAD
jgi:hypothetical protein